MSANYNGTQANNSSYIKYFVPGAPMVLWKTLYYKKDNINEPVVTTASHIYKNVYIPGDLFVDGTITSPSDIKLKKNVALLEDETAEKLMNLKPSSFEFKDDPSSHIHYGFIAGELETEYPELVHNKPDVIHSNVKGINYLEIIPLLVHKIQLMQKEIDLLKEKVV